MTIFGLPRNTETAAAWAESRGLSLSRSVLAQTQVRGEVSSFKRRQADARSLEQARARHRVTPSATALVHSAERSIAACERAMGPRRAQEAEQRRLAAVDREIRAEIARDNEKSVREMDKAARAKALNQRTQRTLVGTPAGRTMARTEIAIEHEAERLRLAHATAEARAFARRF